jgi:hypothetical protein
MMASQKECVDAGELAKALLEYALKPASPELKRGCTPHYLDELLFLKLFSVDYVLGMKAVAQPAFASVRTHYKEEIESFCVSKESPFTHSTVIARFAAYSEACNANTLAPKEYKGKRLVFWELGKAFSRLASEADPWVPSALKVTLHANIFVRDCKRLSDFLEQYDIAQTV